MEVEVKEVAVEAREAMMVETRELAQKVVVALVEKVKETVGGKGHRRR